MSLEYTRKSQSPRMRTLAVGASALTLVAALGAGHALAAGPTPGMLDGSYANITSQISSAQSTADNASTASDNVTAATTSLASLLSSATALNSSASTMYDSALAAGTAASTAQSVLSSATASLSTVTVTVASTSTALSSATSTAATASTAVVTASTALSADQSALSSAGVVCCQEGRIILTLAERGPLSVKELMSRTDIPYRSFYILLGRLKELGLVESVRGREDRRVREISLTRAVMSRLINTDTASNEDCHVMGEAV